MNMYKAPLLVAGIIFTLVAIMHIWRISEGTLILFGTTVVPMWVSYVGLIISAGMAVWIFSSLGCCCRQSCKEGSQNNEMKPKK